MKRKLLIVIAVIIVTTIILLSSIWIQSLPINKAKRFYIEFIEAYIDDPYQAVVEYQYFDDPRYREMALNATEQVWYNYEILDIKQLTPKLWVLTVNIADMFFPEGLTVNHFVGIIDDNYKIIMGAKHLPDTLASQINVNDYTVPGAIDIDDIYGALIIEP